MRQGSENDSHHWICHFAKTRDNVAFTKVVQEYGEMIYASAYRICGNAADSQDVMQQVLVVLARKADELTEVKSLGAWLHRVTVRTAQKMVRNHTRRMNREKSAVQNQQVSQEGLTLAHQIAPELDESLNALKEKDREVLTMHYLEGLTFQRIAEVMGGTAEACQKRSVRALEKLSSKLKSRGIVATGAALAISLNEVKAASSNLTVPVRVLVDQALQQAGSSSAVAGGGLLTQLGLMKAGTAVSITVSLIGGFVLSTAWGHFSTGQENQRLKAKGIQHTSQGDGRSGTQREKAAFSIELVEKEIKRFDALADVDHFHESRMRSLMFTIPEEHLGEVLEMLKKTKNESRFQNIVAAYFGRWAEVFPELAAKESMSMGGFTQSARLGALYTWLDQDADAALNQIIADGIEGDIRRIRDYIAYKLEADPVYAAGIIDTIQPHWPKEEARLKQMVASKWAFTDHEATADWLAKTEDESVRNRLLRQTARKLARLRGSDGLHIADHIEDDTARAEARNYAIYWWGIAVGGYSLKEDARPNLNLSGGFPEDWTDLNIRTFSKTLMVNHKHLLPKLVEIANDETERQMIYQGVIQGSSFSDPKNASQIIVKLDDAYATSKEGSEALKIFTRRWHEKDRNEVNQWVNTLPDGQKKEIIQEELKTMKQP